MPRLSWGREEIEMAEIVASTPFWIEAAVLLLVGFLVTAWVGVKKGYEPVGTAAFFLSGWTGIGCYLLYQFLESATMSPWLAPVVLMLVWVLGIAGIIWLFVFLSLLGD